jgi:hypothetical protein
MRGENTVAEDVYVEQAVADMGSVARAFLERLHRDEVLDARGEAALHLRRLREFARLHGAPLDEMASYHEHITSWRAIARLAGSVIETTQAG